MEVEALAGSAVEAVMSLMRALMQVAVLVRLKAMVDAVAMVLMQVVVV